MKSINLFPQVRKFSKYKRFEYSDPEFHADVQPINESFIVCWHPMGDDKNTHRLEAYPDGDLGASTLMTGTFQECFNGLTRIHNAMIRADIRCKMTMGSLSSQLVFKDAIGIAIEKREKGGNDGKERKEENVRD